MSKRAPPLATKIFYSVLPLTAIVILILGYSGYLAAKREIVAGVDRQIAMLTKEAADHLAVFFNLRDDDTLLLANATSLHDYLKYRSYGLKEEAESHRKELGEYYSHIARERNVYARVSFYNIKGQEIVAATPEGPVGLNPEVNTTLLAVPPRGKVEHSDIDLKKSQEILYWAGVYDDLGHARGNVTLHCDLRHILEVLNRAKIGRTGQASLVNAQGQDLISIGGTSFTDAISGSAPVPGTSWKVRLKVTPKEFLAPLHQVERWTAVVSTVALVFLFIWIGFFVRQAVDPISTMAEGTKRIAQGDLDFRVNPSGIQELNVLGDSFNDMAAKLKERNLQLEARIRQLTALRDMEGAVIQHLDEEAVLRACLKAAVDGLSLDRAALYWVNEIRQEIVGRLLYRGEDTGLTEETFRGRHVPLGEKELLNDVIRNRTAVLMRLPSNDPRLNPAFIEGAKTREFVMAPICGKDRVFGVLTADNYSSRRPLQESDREGLSLFANAVGLAIENSILFQHLAESEARHRSVIENSPVAVLGLSRELHITTWNQGAEKIFGYTAAEMSGKPLTALFTQDANKEFQKLLAEMLAKGSVRDYPMKGCGKAGRPLDLSLSWGGAHREFWLNREWAVVIHDVTEAHKLQQQLIQSEKLSVVGQLISSIAHELNNPLQAVVGYSQLLADQSLETTSKSIKRSEFQDDLREILQSALRCRKIIENLLFFVRQGGVNKEAISLEKAARAAAELLEYKLSKSDTVKVVYKIPKNLPQIHGNPQQIQQVFINLINNACDAMSGQKTPKAITIRAAAETGRIRMEVEDSGPGVPPELREKIFEAFFTTKPAGRGTGIGLALCGQIVQEHGGKMGVGAGAGGGALFWMEFPEYVQSVQTVAKKRRQTVPQVPGKSVLLVDDETTLLALLRQAIEADAGNVELAGTVKEAFQKAGQRTFDLVVSDILLADGNGFELYERWEERVQLPKPRFLFMTGDILNESLTKITGDHGIPLLHKPIDLNDFIQAVRRVLSEKKVSA